MHLCPVEVAAVVAAVPVLGLVIAKIRTFAKDLVRRLA